MQDFFYVTYVVTLSCFWYKCVKTKLVFDKIKLFICNYVCLRIFGFYENFIWNKNYYLILQ